jgi:hypothetical protein
MSDAQTFTITLLSGGDSDEDGIPDAWELANGTDPRMPDGSADPDGDGFTNLQEYLAGTNPHDATSVLRITSISLETGNHSAALSFLAVSNRTYSIRCSTNPSAGPWQKVVDIAAVPRTGVVTVTNLPCSGPSRFYRVGTGL